jgi:hypothetical protein
MPRTGPATAACKKMEVNILHWNWTVLVMKEGTGFLFAPLRKEQDGLLLEEQGTMFNVAPVSAKNLSFVKSSVRKIKPSSAGKCMAVAVACKGIAA